MKTENITVTDVGLKIQPVNHYVLAKVNGEREETNEMGFVLPSNFHQQPMEAEVVSVGSDAKTDDFTVSVGDTILLPKTGSTKVMIGNTEYQLCSVFDIIGVV